ncbi:hypothetical protein BX257_5011 [Streptomyces sp. 3212.3]|nr:hypothetical protein BX257_5011 [Streptomyces sp. 3212.3]
MSWCGGSAKRLDVEAAHVRRVVDEHGAEWKAARDWVSSGTGAD